MSNQQLLNGANEFFTSMRATLNTLMEQVQQFTVEAVALAHSDRPEILAISPDTETLEPENYIMDRALQQAAPVVIVPKYCEFAPLKENGHRFLMAADGLHVEIRRPWLHLIQPIAKQSAVAIPFGDAPTITEMTFGRLSAALPLIRNFARQATAALPNETAAMIVWNDDMKKLQELPVECEGTPGSVIYTLPELCDYESIAIDMHSHGHLPAFFSGEDNRDDAGSVKISIVLGELDRPMPSVKVRLCALGLYADIPVPAKLIFEGLTMPLMETEGT